MKFKLPATQGKQGNQTYFTATISIGEVVKLFEFTDPNIPAELRAQRVITPKRASAIAEYVLKRSQDYIIPAITSEIEGEVEFLPFDEEHPDIGYLEFGTTAILTITDGQHRVKGLSEALEEYPELKDDTVSIQFYFYKNLQQSQIRFSDINRNAKATTTSLNQLYDHNDVVAKISRGVLKKVGNLDEHMEKEKNSTAGNSSKIMSFRDFYAANKVIHNQLQKLEKPPAYIKEVSLISTYWQIITELHTEWQEIFTQQRAPINCRTFTIALHGISIAALGYVGAEILIPLTTERDIEPKLRTGLTKFSKINWKKNHSPILRICIERGKVVKNNSTVRQLADHILESLK